MTEMASATRAAEEMHLLWGLPVTSRLASLFDYIPLRQSIADEFKDEASRRGHQKRTGERLVSHKAQLEAPRPQYLQLYSIKVRCNTGRRF